MLGDGWLRPLGASVAQRAAMLAEQQTQKLRAVGYDPGRLPAILAGLPAVGAPDLSGVNDRLRGVVRQEVERRAVEREARLRGELAALLAAGHLVDDLVIVTSPLHPDGVLMTRAQCDAHGVDLAAAVNRWAAS